MTTPYDLSGLQTGYRNQRLVEKIPTSSTEYVYLKTIYGAIVRLKREKVEQLLKLLNVHKIKRRTGDARTNYDYKKLIMQAPEYALMIPIIARERPDLVDDEVLNYYDECSQHVEDAAIAILSKSMTKINPKAKSKPKPINLEDVE